MELFEHIRLQLRSQVTVLTPNRRLSATLLRHYNQYQQSLGQLSWPSPSIVPLTRWLEQLWQEASFAQLGPIRRKLTATQEQLLWDEILKASPATERLLQIEAAAETAKSAWGILKQWRVPLDHPALATTEDSHVFLQWATRFQALCDENQWLDANQFIEQLTQCIQERFIQLPERILVCGFTELTPLQEHLFTVCQKAGTDIVFYDQLYPHEKNDTPVQIGLTDTETEIISMARWALKKNHASSPSIGCIVPNLETIREQVLRIFTEVFSENQCYTVDPTTLPFNISAGKNLATYPIIYAALQWLQLPLQTLSYETMSRLLRSPFLGEAEKEQAQRALFDIHLCNTQRTPLSLLQILQSALPVNLKNKCPYLYKRCAAFLEQYHTLSTATSNTWANHFLELLTVLGWPGERSLNSPEYQIVQRWLELLEELASINHFVPAQNYESALHYLIRITNTTLYQPKTPEAPIQILGLLEAAGSPFDYLWVMGTDDANWPPPLKPNPFLPQRLQKTLKMPHASAERELTYSKRLLEQLIQNTSHIIFSYPKQNAECQLRPSPLISTLPEITLEELDLPPFIHPAETIYQTQALETITDEFGPAILPTEQIRGGMQIFKHQAACPFKAFAEIRLQAKQHEPPTLGLRYQDRGTVVHKALEFIWQEIKTSTRLVDYPDAELNAFITTCVTQALEKVAHQQTAQKRYLQLEIERVTTLLRNWLDIEKNRPPFSIVSQEQECSVTLGSIPLTLRIDRIDKLDDGAQLIIDYKTGKNNPIQSWFSDRPDEPQLPLYCTVNQPNTIGIAFAEIHQENLGLKGIAKQDISIKTIKPIHDTPYAENRTWAEQIHAWQQTLEKISHDFSQGHAKVDPKNNSETCRYCHLHAFCRVYAV